MPWNWPPAATHPLSLAARYPVARVPLRVYANSASASRNMIPFRIDHASAGSRCSVQSPAVPLSIIKNDPTSRGLIDHQDLRRGRPDARANRSCTFRKVSFSKFCFSPNSAMKSPPPSPTTFLKLLDNFSCLLLPTRVRGRKRLIAKFFQFYVQRLWLARLRSRTRRSSCASSSPVGALVEHEYDLLFHGILRLPLRVEYHH